MKQFFRKAVRVLLIAYAISWLWILAIKWLPVWATPLMVIRLFEGQGWKHHYVPESKISPHVFNAFVAAEDQKFYNHHGFDWESMRKAYESNKKGKKIRGGSTISQQTAKNVFLWPKRSWLRKGFEAYFTFCIELVWSKKRILTVYANIVELGPGVYGVDAAAQHYFNKKAENLNREQAALLAAVLPAPLKYSVKNPGPYMRKRQQWILRQMRNING